MKSPTYLGTDTCSCADYCRPSCARQANAIGGRNEKAVKEYLEKNWAADLTETDAVLLTVKALLEVAAATAFTKIMNRSMIIYA